MCTWVAVVGPVPAARFIVPQQLRAEGVAVVVDDVERRIESGRGRYVAEVVVTFQADDRTIVTSLQHVQDVEAQDVVVPPERTGWGDGPPAWREQGAEIPADSRYAPPLTVRYLADDPEVAMAQADLDALAEGAGWRPVAAFYLLPLPFVVLVPRLRRLAFRRSPNRERGRKG
jgi:hypothetical protein